jgi:hypothetical protein
MDRTFTLAEARALVPALREHVARLAALRADLAEAHVALANGAQPDVGGLPEVKSLEAHLQDSVDWFVRQGIELKGLAPVIVDLPSVLGADPVLLCWLEGEQSIDWYHGTETGFAGRRRLPRG